MTIQKGLALLIILFLLFSCACSVLVKSPRATPVSAPLGDPLSRLSIDTQNEMSINPQINLFISGTPSMMGFVDWKYETKYANVLTRLFTVLSESTQEANLSIYRIDLDLPLEYMKVESVEKLKSYFKERRFYTYSDIESIPKNVTRYPKYDQNLPETITGWYHSSQDEDIESQIAEAIQQGLPSSTAEIAIKKHFDSDSLNVLVTDLYELRNNAIGFNKLKSDFIDKGLSVAVLAFTSEFSGYLPDFTAHDQSIICGSAPTGFYKSHRTLRRDGVYANGTPWYYYYNVYESWKMDDRDFELRPFYVIIAGKPQDVRNIVASLEANLDSVYNNSSPTILDPSSDTLKKIIYEHESIIYDSLYIDSIINPSKININYDESGVIPLGYGSEYVDAHCFEVQANRNGKIRVTAPFKQNHEIDQRQLNKEDFTVSNTLIDIDDGSTKSMYHEFELSQVNELVFTYNFGDMNIAKGKYILETSIEISSPKKEYSDLLDWNWSIDTASLYNLAANNELSELHFDKTIGLRVLTTSLSKSVSENLKPMTILVFRIYVEIV